MSTESIDIDHPHSQPVDAAAYIPWVIVVACAASLLVLLRQYSHDIPDQLQKQAELLLQSRPHPETISVESSGRDLHLTGSMGPGQSLAAISTELKSIQGVRTVKDKVIIVDPITLSEKRSSSFQQKLAQVDLSRVAFQPGSVLFTDQSEQALQALLELMGAYPQQRIRIEGHSDNTGPDAVNLNLSRDRANAVANYLASRGVALDRLIVKGYGSTQPIADNSTESGRARNRRIEISHVL